MMAKEKIDREDIEQKLQQERQDRSNRCKDKINKVLEEENCQFDVAVTVTAKGNFPVINIVPNNGRNR